MRIDGRFDPKQWIQPRTDETVVSTKIEEQRDEREFAFTAAEQRESDLDFASEIQKSYAYTHASRTAEMVAEMMEVTPDL